MHKEISKHKAEVIGQQMEALIERQKLDLHNFLNKSFGRMVSIRSNVTLRMLPMWGPATNDKINFQWPTQEQLD